jgi:hypothetical protein
VIALRASTPIQLPHMSRVVSFEFLASASPNCLASVVANPGLAQVQSLECRVPRNPLNTLSAMLFSLKFSVGVVSAEFS